MSCLATDVTEPHHDIKALATLEGNSINQYTLERLLPADESAALLELQGLLQSRLMAAEGAEASPLTAVEIAEQTLRETDMAGRPRFIHA
jgi:hypothetical protein